MTDRKPVLAVSVGLVNGRTVLLVKRALPPAQGFYAFPGGRVEAGETLEDAARRELREETGLEAGPLAPVETMMIEPMAGDSGTVFELTVFSGPFVGGKPVASSDAAEAAFFSLHEMRALLLAGSVGSISERLIGVSSACSPCP